MQPSRLLRQIAALLAAVAALTVTLTACNRNNTSPAETGAATTAQLTAQTPDTPEPDYVYTPPAIEFYPAIKANGSPQNTLRFADQAEKDTWIEPLTKLLSNVTPMPGDRSASPAEGGPEGHAEDENAPAVPASLACALLDITADGVPELLVFPLGGGGSSGNAYYEVFDIFSGENLGSMDGGYDDQWCYYYDTEGDEYRLYGHFWWRIGWSGRQRHIQKIAFLEERQTYESVSYLREEYHLDALLETTPDGLEGWEEICTGVDYYLNSQSAYLDDYYAEYDHFRETCILIPETGLTLVRWSDLYGEDFDYSAPPELRAEYAAAMAHALTHTEQAFLKP